MQPWFIATEPFRPGHPEWARFVEWSGLRQLEEVVFDPILCPTVLPEIKAEYWPHIVNEDFMLQFFVNYDFFREQIAGIPAKNVLCVVRNPEGQPALPALARRLHVPGLRRGGRAVECQRAHQLRWLSRGVRQCRALAARAC